ncbi:MAG: hypothetical protein IKU38_09430 [Clostridia bacterium]|nr:hypothetical protein [Clostridia bacterium]
MKEAIRLTNRTAIGLRKSAQKIRRAYFAAEIIISIALGVLGVVLGFMWLPAVPVMIVLIALIDCALMIASRNRYLSLLGQAICTEAAARELSMQRSEKKRREQKDKDLMRMKADVEKALENKPDAEPFFEEKNDEEQDGDDPAGEEDQLSRPEEHRRRRRQNPLTLIRSEQAK